MRGFQQESWNGIWIHPAWKPRLCIVRSILMFFIFVAFGLTGAYSIHYEIWSPLIMRYDLWTLRPISIWRRTRFALHLLCCPLRNLSNAWYTSGSHKYKTLVFAFVGLCGKSVSIWVSNSALTLVFLCAWPFVFAWAFTFFSFFSMYFIVHSRLLNAWHIHITKI